MQVELSTAYFKSHSEEMQTRETPKYFDFLEQFFSDKSFNGNYWCPHVEFLFNAFHEAGLYEHPTTDVMVACLFMKMPAEIHPDIEGIRICRLLTHAMKEIGADKFSNFTPA